MVLKRKMSDQLSDLGSCLVRDSCRPLPGNDAHARLHQRHAGADTCALVDLHQAIAANADAAEKRARGSSARCHPYVPPAEMEQGASNGESRRAMYCLTIQGEFNFHGANLIMRSGKRMRCFVVFVHFAASLRMRILPDHGRAPVAYQASAGIQRSAHSVRLDFQVWRLQHLDHQERQDVMFARPD